MIRHTEEQKELEEQAIALKWQSDVRWLRKTLKFEAPKNLSALRETQYFAEDYLPRITMGRSLSDVILASFIQDLPYSKWQTGAIKNVKKFISQDNVSMLERWPIRKKKIFGKNPRLLKDFRLSALDVARLYSALKFDHSFSMRRDPKDVIPSLLSNRALLGVAQALPFFDETSEWSEKAQKNFLNVLVDNFSRNLVRQSPFHRSNRIVQMLAQTILSEENTKRSAFMIKMLGLVADSFQDKTNHPALDMLVKNLTNQKRFDEVRDVKQAFHLNDSNLKSRFSFFKFFKREK